MSNTELETSLPHAHMAEIGDEAGSPFGSQLLRCLTQSPCFQTEGLDEEPKPEQKRLMRHVSNLMAAFSLDDGIRNKGLKSLYVVAFLHIETPISVESLRQIVQDRLFQLPRFRSRAMVDEKGNYSFFELDSKRLDLTQLVSEVDNIKTHEELDEWVSGVYDRPMDLTLPLWRAYVMNNMANGRHLLCWVINHCIADGAALVAALMSILDDADFVPEAQRPKPLKSKVGCFRGAWLCLSGLFNATIGDQLPGDKMNRLKERNHRRPDPQKALSQSPVLSLQKIKEVKEKFPGATINDVLMTVVSLALQSYFQRYDPEVIEKKHKVRANFPINLRRGNEELTHEEHFGNRFAVGYLSFPVHIQDPCEMLLSLKQQIDIVKVSPEPFFRDAVVRVLAKSPLSRATVADLALDLYGKVTVMLSNVPGPQSYAGKISCGVVVSKSCEPNAERISELWVPSFEKLYQAAMARP